MSRHFVYICLMLMLITLSCKQRKLVKRTSESAFSLVTVDSLLKKNTFEWSFLQATADVSFSGEALNQNVNATIKMEKDKIILISARAFGIEAARIYMEEDSITVLNRLGRTYSRMGWQEAGDYIGSKLDLPMTQNLLMGRLLIPADSQFALSQDTVLYWLERISSDMMYKVRMDSFNHQIDTFYFRGSKTGKYLQVQYQNFEKVDSLTLPKQFFLRAKDGLKRFNGNIEFTSLSTARFQWSTQIPSSFKRQK